MSDDPAGRRQFLEWISRPEMLVGLGALLLSVCGLFISIYEASLIRRQQRASVWPHVSVELSMRPEGVEFRVENTGVGPARIRAAAVTFRGETQAGWGALVRSLGTEYADIGYYRSLVNGHVLPPSDFETIFALTADEEGKARELAATLSREIEQGTVDIAVCYCSVYDQCWTSRLQDVVERFQGTRARLDPPAVEDCEDMPVSGI